MFGVLREITRNIIMLLYYISNAKTFEHACSHKHLSIIKWITWHITRHRQHTTTDRFSEMEAYDLV